MSAVIDGTTTGAGIGSPVTVGPAATKATAAAAPPAGSTVGPDADAPSVAADQAAGGGGRKPGMPSLRLPAVRLPAVRLPAVRLPKVALPARPVLHRPNLHLPRPGRPALEDLVFSVGAATLVLSVVFVLSEPARARLQARTDETAITANAATLQLAAETYAAANGGRHARNVLELVPFLPGGTAPRNPYTDEPTLFRGIAGDLTYRPVAGGGYVIEAWGQGPARPRLLTRLSGAAQESSH